MEARHGVDQLARTTLFLKKMRAPRPGSARREKEKTRAVPISSVKRLAPRRPHASNVALRPSPTQLHKRKMNRQATRPPAASASPERRAAQDRPESPRHAEPRRVPEQSAPEPLPAQEHAQEKGAAGIPEASGADEAPKKRPARAAKSRSKKNPQALFAYAEDSDDDNGELSFDM